MFVKRRMRSGKKEIRGEEKHRQVQKKKERIINAFASIPEAKHGAVTKVVRQVLLNGPYLLRGRFWEVKSKSLGAGVYELSLELKNG